jgi:hypothetical protein
VVQPFDDTERYQPSAAEVRQAEHEECGGRTHPARMPVEQVDDRASAGPSSQAQTGGEQDDRPSRVFGRRERCRDQAAQHERAGVRLGRATARVPGDDPVALA